MTTQRPLWKENRVDTRETYQEIRQRFARTPPLQPWWHFVADAVVLVQELVLTVFFLVRHRVSLQSERGELSIPEDRINLSSNLVLGALALVSYYNARSKPLQSRKQKVSQRLPDSLLLAVLLRLVSGLLRTLTASYSSDTVDALAFTCMALHVFACNYAYANGRGKLATSRLLPDQRPEFRGGTLSLNAAFFATILLISRLESNLTTYFYVALAIVLFAFYPATRYAISLDRPARSHPAHWLLTTLLVGASVLLLDDEKHVWLLSVVVILLLVIPTWQHCLQRSKVHLPGPWDLPRSEDLVRSSKKDD